MSPQLRQVPIFKQQQQRQQVLMAAAAAEALLDFAQLAMLIRTQECQ